MDVLQPDQGGDTKNILSSFEIFVASDSLISQSRDVVAKTRKELVEYQSDKYPPGIRERATILILSLLLSEIPTFSSHEGRTSAEQTRDIALDITHFKTFVERRNSPNRSGFTWSSSFHDHSLTMIKEALPPIGDGRYIDDGHGIIIKRYVTCIPGIFFEERSYNEVNPVFGFDGGEVSEQYHYLPDEA